MKKRILIIGKRGLTGSNLNLYLKKKNYVTNIDYKKFIKKKDEFINKFDWVVNCTSNRDYINGRYKKKNDFDLAVANKIKKTTSKMIMLSSRKVYKIGANLKETSPTAPKNNYSKNKLKTEKVLTKILKKKILILRISNIIGLNIKKCNKLHKVFIDIFYENVKRGLIFDNKNFYKDFISINKFCEIVEKLIFNNAYGVYNVSLGKKIFLRRIVSWLNFYNKKKIKFINTSEKYQVDNFSLNNDKLMNLIKIKNTTQDLKKYCVELSKKLFKK